MIHFHPPAVIPLLFPILSNKCELKQRIKQPTPLLTSTLPYTPSRSSTSALPAFSACAESTILPSISLHLSHFSFYCFPLCSTSASCSAVPAPPAELQTLVSRTRLSSHHPVQTNKTVIKYTNPLCRTDFSTSYCTTIGHRFNINVARSPLPTLNSAFSSGCPSPRNDPTISRITFFISLSFDCLQLRSYSFTAVSTRFSISRAASLSLSPVYIPSPRFSLPRAAAREETPGTARRQSGFPRSAATVSPTPT